MNWINHVKQYAKQHNISYPQALKEAKMSYGGRLVKTKKDEELFDTLYKTGSQTVYVPPQMAFINNRGKKEIINTLTPKLNISRRNKQKVLQIEPNTTNEFRIVNGKIVDSHNKEITLQKFKKILDDDKHLNDTNDKLNKQYEQINMENENIYNTRNNVKLFNNIKNDSKKINVANKKINDDYEQLMKEHENIKHTNSIYPSNFTDFLARLFELQIRTDKEYNLKHKQFHLPENPSKYYNIPYKYDNATKTNFIGDYSLKTNFIGDYSFSLNEYILATIDKNEIANALNNNTKYKVNPNETREIIINKFNRMKFPKQQIILDEIKRNTKNKKIISLIKIQQQEEKEIVNERFERGFNRANKLDDINNKINDDYEQLMKENENIKHCTSTQSREKKFFLN